ncbi:FAD-dependent oxidoreductase [Actinokineospora spheciospongiae]|uniref:FAD-dependent oxidoreductase n=1 Tax=Actinokineospora spheciospongiae TaxID=909613 RepID=UPI000D71238C|nr:FAD-dependent oxidoreductase [Actinokineospora spheciospongiae]PWW53031.1 phytoene dehydrogenase-like protein [Actinokineospora spheciospongiae]
MSTTDVVVVGGGLAGLTAAAVLSRRGHRVVLVEAGGELGGRARTTSVAGFSLNLGPRALYKGYTYRMLRSLGIRLRAGTPAVGDGRALRAGELTPGYASAFGLLRSPLFSLRERAALGAFLGLTRTAPAGLTAEEWLADALPTERTREAAFGLLRVSCYTGSPAMIDARSVAAQLALVRKGVLYVDGGWSSIVDALRRAAPTATLRTGTAAREVEPGRVTLADGTTLDAPAVLLAGLPPAKAASLLDVELTTAPVRTACLDVALSHLPSATPGFVYGLDEPLYYAVHSHAARLGPGAVVHLARFDDGTAPKDTRARLESLLEQCQPGWRDHVVHQRFLPAITTTHGPGAADTLAAALADRPGVHASGDWTGSTALLADGAVESTLRACDRISARLAHPRPVPVPGGSR